VSGLRVKGSIAASALIVPVCAVLFVASGCGGGGVSCGDSLPQPDGTKFYRSVDGDPVVRGDLSCKDLQDLVTTIKNNPKEPELSKALKKNGGWTVVPEAYAQVGQAGDLVVGRPGNQVAFSPTLGF